MPVNLGVATVGLVAAFTAAQVSFARLTDDEVTFRLLRKDMPMTVYSEGDMRPAIAHRLITDKGIFTDESSLLSGKFRAGRIERGLKEGGTYTCRVSGVDIPDVEIRRNVTRCRPAAP